MRKLYETSLLAVFLDGDVVYVHNRDCDVYAKVFLSPQGLDVTAEHSAEASFQISGPFKYPTLQIRVRT